MRRIDDVPTIVPMDVPGEAPRPGLLAPPASRSGGRKGVAPSYLTGSPAGWRFQWRPPRGAGFEKTRPTPSNSCIIRRWLGPARRRDAEHTARQLATLCRTIWTAASRGGHRLVQESPSGDGSDLLAAIVEPATPRSTRRSPRRKRLRVSQKVSPEHWRPSAWSPARSPRATAAFPPSPRTPRPSSGTRSPASCPMPHMRTPPVPRSRTPAQFSPEHPRRLPSRHRRTTRRSAARHRGGCRPSMRSRNPTSTCGSRATARTTRTSNI
jgi:hypothetical protein